jgi:transglutaminase-like putative cysteine protease
MKVWPRVVYFFLFVGVAAVAALALNGAVRPSASADLLRAVFVASLCAAPGLIHRKAWPAALILVPLGAYLVLRATLPLPATVEGLGGQASYYLEQTRLGAEQYTQKVFPMALGDAPGLRMFLTAVVYWLTAVAAFLALSLRRPLAGIVPLLLLLGFGLTVDETPRLVWAAVLFLVLAACLLVVSRGLQRGDWRLRDAGTGAAVGVLASALALLLLGAAPSAAAEPWQDWRTWDPFRTGGAGYSFNWLQNYPQLLDPANDRLVMEVDSPAPAYWRANALDSFTGYAWIASQGFAQEVERSAGADGFVYSVPPADPSPAGKKVEQSFRIRSVYTNYFFTGGDPVSLALGQEVDIRTNDMRALHVVAALGPSLDYTLTSVIPAVRPAGLVGLGSEYPEVLAHYRLLPFPRVDQLQGPDPEAAWRQTVANVTADGEQWVDLYALNQEIVGDATDPYEITLRVERYLRRFHQYSLTPPASDYSSPYAAFLFDTRLGYCQHFAGSMALLLRYNGIPARVAVGFTTGDEGPPDTYTVSTNSAHSWVEAFFPTVGWVSFDPTPGRNLPTPGPSSTTPGFADPFADNAGPGGGTVPTLPSGQIRPEDGPEGGDTEAGGTSWFSRASWLPWLLALLLILVAWPGIRASWRRRDLHRGTPQRRLMASLRLLRSSLADHGIATAPGQTLDEVLDAVRARTGVEPEPGFVARTQAVLYGGRATRPADVERAETLRRRVAGELRRRRGWAGTVLTWYGLRGR